MSKKMYKGLKMFTSVDRGIKGSNKVARFYVKNKRDNTIKLYSKNNKTARRIKSSELHSNNNSEMSVESRKKTKRRKSLVSRKGKINRSLCSQSSTTSRCRYLRGNEKHSDNCYVNNKSKRCNKIIRKKRKHLFRSIRKHRKNSSNRN